MMTDEERNDAARKAVAAFRKMQPGLTAFARALSSNDKLRVEMGERTSTDGNVILFRPTIALGQNLKHDRAVCDLRSLVSRELMCPACLRHEEVLVSIYHEIGHIVFDSFAAVSDEDKVGAIRRAVVESKLKSSKLVERQIANDPSLTQSYIGLSHLVSPYLPAITNILEDVRVNRSTWQVRPGTKVMFYARDMRLAQMGVEQPDMTRMKWADYAPNAQVAIGMMMKVTGRPIEPFLHPQVAKDINDETLLMLVNRIHTLRSAAEVFGLAYEVLLRLRELGYCKDENTPEPEPEEEPEDDKTESHPEGEGGTPPNDPAGTDAPNEEDDDSGTDMAEDAPGDEDNESSGSSGEGDVESDDGSDGGSGDGDSEENAAGGSEEGDDASGSDADSDGEADSGDGSDQPEESSEGQPSSGGSALGDGNPEGASPADSETVDPGIDGSAASGSELAPAGSNEHGAEIDGDADSSEAAEPAAERQLSDPNAPVDTGADEGNGGIKADPSTMGTPNDVSDAVGGLCASHDHDADTPEEDALDAAAVVVAIIQGMYFETPSQNVRGVNIHKFNDAEPGEAWSGRVRRRAGIRADVSGVDIDHHVPESVLGSVLLRMRVAFGENKRVQRQPNLTSGRVNGRALGKRGWGDDDRLFKRRTVPTKRDYFVVIGIDISGSTIGQNLRLAKRAALAQSQLLSRMGIKFAIYAHSARSEYNPDIGQYEYNLEIYEIKDGAEPWSKNVQERFYALGSDSENLDGHSLEYYRKRCDESTATDKIILYYTDGKMPAANYEEELEILQRELKVCKQKGYHALGVGIRTDSPTRHGMDTVRVDADSDLVNVVKFLEKRLM